MPRPRVAGPIGLVWALCGLACARAPLDARPPPEPPPDPATDPKPQPEPCDRDGDGYRATECGGDDCNDADPTVHPGAPDLNAIAGRWTTIRAITRAQYGPVASSPTIAVDRGGGVHIAYPGGAGLLVATRVGGGWQIETVDSRPEQKPGLALDAGGAVHLAYTLATGVRHATRAGAAWVIETVDPAGKGPPAIALERGGAIHVAYTATDGLRHATNRDGPWTIETVDPHGVNPSMAVDATGTAHLTYGNGVDREGFLRYATGSAGAWRITTPTDTRAWTGSIALGRDGLPRIAVASMYITDTDVHILTQVASGWSDDRILTDNALYSVMLRLDGRDEPHVLFSHLGDIAYATRSRDGWRSEPIDVRGSYGVNPSLDLDGAGTAHVASTSFFYPSDIDVEYSSNRELAPDGVDQNCDGVDGIDADGDGHASLWTAGDDCDDGDPSSPFTAAGDAGMGCPPPP